MRRQSLGNMLIKNHEERNTINGKLRISETLFTGIFLTVVGGFLDAYTYLMRGGVFANGQTGNLVLLGIRLAERDFHQASYYVFPILAFLLGVFLTESIQRHINDDRFIKWRHIILALEILLLTICFFLPTDRTDRMVNITISFVCALQTQAFRSLRGLSYISVMCTGNLRSGVQELCNYRMFRERQHLVNSCYYFIIVLSFVAGAAAGTLLAKSFGHFSLIFPVALLGIVLVLLLLRKQLTDIVDRFGLGWLDR